MEAADVTAYETLYSLPAIQPNVVVLPTGSDPGYTADSTEGEAVLDVDRVLATAPGAGPDLLIAKNALAFSVTFSLLQYNISTLNDPIQSLSFGACEYSATSRTYALQFDSYFATAAAQGIGTYISSGDNGAAGCDAGSTTIPSTQVIAPNLLCASSYATCVGGTEFADFTNPSAFWSSTNSTTKVSALGYIPEGAWNEPITTNSAGTTVYRATGTGGGASTAIPKPAFQTGVGVPADGARDTPDVSFAGSTHNAYVLCYAAAGATCATGGYVYPVGGTSASAPSMAGVAALLNQKRGARQGNLNPLFYRLAASPANGVFHDVTPATAGVTPCDVATPSLCNNSTPSPTSLTGGLTGYPVTTGFDLATGLGSLDVTAFITAANIGITPSTITLGASPNPTTVGAGTILTATITPTGNAVPAGAIPAGTVQFYLDGKVIGLPADVSAGLATFTYNAPSAGIFPLTAIYSGDPTFASQTAAAVSLQIDPAPFTVTPSLSSLTLTSAAGNAGTASLRVASAGTFAGAVALSCRVLHLSGTAAATCTIAPDTVTVDAGGADSSASLTVNALPGTSGNLQVLVTGTSGTLNYTAPPIAVTVTAPGFTIAATPSSASILAGDTATSLLTVTSANLFTGTVALSCTVKAASGNAAGSCQVSPATAQLDSGASASSMLTVSTSTGTSGVLTVSVSGTGATTGASIGASATATVTVTVDTPRFTLTASPSTLGTLSAGATSGNVSTITLTSVNGLAAAVQLTCTAALTTGGAVSNPPGCSLTPASVTLSPNGSQTAVATLATAAGSSSCLTAGFTLPAGRHPTGSRSASLLAIAALCGLLLPFGRSRRRRLPKLLLSVSLLAALTSLAGCGGGGTPRTPCTNVIAGRTTAGTYTVTVTGVSGSLTSSTTFTVTVN